MNNSSNSSKAIDRRHFMGTCGKMSSISMLSSLLHLKMLNAAVSSNTNIDSDYKALVCVFMSGGNDSFNMLAPWSYHQHANYLTAREHLALTKGDLLSIKSNSSKNMRFFGIHNKMPLLRNMYNSSDTAFVANVGTLVRPTTLNDVEKNQELPKGLYSHREQQVAWQTSVPGNDSAKGWIGRMSEILNDTDSSSTDVSLNYSINGSCRLLSGNKVGPTVLGTGGASTLDSYERSDIKAAKDISLDYKYDNVIKQHYGYKFKEIIEKGKFYNDTISGLADPFPSDLFPTTSLGQQLKRVALTINARDPLGAKRQSFFVSFGSFDHHGGLIANQAVLLAELDGALHAFNEAMKIIKLHDNVTTYTASDFGRTISSNSNGTDHAWGGNQILMGGAVNGEQVHGIYPNDLRVGASDLDTGRGRFIPSTSVDELHAELALWYGAGTSDLSTIIPNIDNFDYSPKGFLNI